MHNGVNTDLHYVVQGSGPPVLLMHGGLGLDHTMFRPFLDPLAEHFTLIFYDHRGNGRSPRPDDYNSLSHETWIEDAESLRAGLGFEQWVVVGQSYGGALALEYALRYPERLNGIVVCSAAPAYNHAERALEIARRRATTEQFNALLRAFTEPVSDDDALEDIVRTTAPIYLHRPSAVLISRMFDDVVYSAEAANRSLQECLPGFDIRGQLEDIDVPALVVAGESDWLCPPGVGIEPFVDAMSIARGVVFHESGHHPYAEEPERFRDVVTDWLSVVL